MIYAEGLGLAQILAIRGVNSYKSFSNHIT